MKTKYWRTTHKFGIRIPKTVQEALKIDEENGNTLWYNSIQREMSNVCIAFDKKEKVSIKDVRTGKALIESQEIKCHIIFDIK